MKRRNFCKQKKLPIFKSYSLWIAPAISCCDGLFMFILAFVVAAAAGGGGDLLSFRAFFWHEFGSNFVPKKKKSSDLESLISGKWGSRIEEWISSPLWRSLFDFCPPLSHFDPRAHHKDRSLPLRPLYLSMLGMGANCANSLTFIRIQNWLSRLGLGVWNPLYLPLPLSLPLSASSSSSFFRKSSKRRNVSVIAEISICVSPSLRVIENFNCLTIRLLLSTHRTLARSWSRPPSAVSKSEIERTAFQWTYGCFEIHRLQPCLMMGMYWLRWILIDF